MKCIQGNVVFLFWAPDGDPPDPEAVARRLITEIGFQAIEIGTFPHTTTQSPGAVSVVGWPMWLWANNPTPHNWGPISASTTEEGYQVSLSAIVTKVTWDMGNGDAITCDAGTPFTKQLQDPTEISPDCGYVYPKPGTYEITATSHWLISWNGIGESGTIEENLSRTATMTIKELHILNVPGPDQ